jgi:hypothetical protein
MAIIDMHHRRTSLNFGFITSMKEGAVREKKAKAVRELLKGLREQARSSLNESIDLG